LDLNLLVGRSVAALETPREDLFVRAPLKHAVNQRLVLDAQKARAAGVKVGPICRARKIFGRQPTGGTKPTE